jgi:acyl-coenzyme A synthetase/AMP-(fatty) acid ligase
MLYRRWLQIARERARETALTDVAARRRWTFSELAAWAESACRPESPIVYPQGNSAAFVLAVLRAWRWNLVVCPLELGQGPPLVPLPPADCVHLKLTSATTGVPRVIAFTAAQLAADAENIMVTMGLRPEWPNLGAISLAHSYGFSNLVLPLLLHGIPLIIAPSPLPEAVRCAVEGKSALTLAGVPALWRAWHEAGAIPPCARLAISAGAPLPLTVERAVFESSGLKIHNFYGSSECGGIAYDAANVPRDDDACVGSPMGNVQVSLNEESCIRVRSCAVGQTYWPDPSDTLGDGCFQTGDIADLKDGHIYLRGRLSDQINVAGQKVFPTAIERVLAEHRAVRECLVFGVPSGDAHRTDVIVACVAASAPIATAELKQFLLTKLPAWQVPREWWFVESLTATQRGKLPRTEWRRRFLEMREKRTTGV